MLQKTRCTSVASVPTSGRSLDDLLGKEWLLTNSRGGYASSTVIGCNTRRYHGLLIGSLNPPVDRIMALANCLEMVITDQSAGSITANVTGLRRMFNLSAFEFNDKIIPDGFTFLKQFRQDTGVHFDYRICSQDSAARKNNPGGIIELTKSVYLAREEDVVAIVYDFTRLDKKAEFVLRPFTGLRDFHSLQKSYAPLCAEFSDDGLLIHHDTPGSCELFLKCPSMDFEQDPQWWFNFVYRNDRARGQDFAEDLWTPGFYRCRIDSPAKIVFWANLASSGADRPPGCNYDISAVRRKLLRHQRDIRKNANGRRRDHQFDILCLAADQFISKQRTNRHYRTTVLAGYPWFADWGRDAFISLPGLLLATGRYEEAKSVLTTFAAAADDGLIPNRFDDRSDTAYFNSIDASLWFINAAFEYLKTTRDTEVFAGELLPKIHWIIDSYYNGTRFGTHADSDGLVTAGDQGTQLTWMDAKFDGVAFTPRYGKAVEVNALWYNSLCLIAEYYNRLNSRQEYEHYKGVAEKVGRSFSEVFWNETKNYLNDCVLPDGTVDDTFRPNQIFAVSLPFSPLSPHQQRAVVEMVRQRLLTPFGLRTLPPSDSRYKGRYTGPQQDRDQAYHQGTVWPYLMGAFIEAYLKVNGSTRDSKNKAAEFIRPLIGHLVEDGCLGQLPEIFDGDVPHQPKGCIAQAWSVAELIRSVVMTR